MRMPLASLAHLNLLGTRYSRFIQLLVWFIFAYLIVLNYNVEMQFVAKYRVIGFILTPCAYLSTF
jgi:hypothetical protein